MLLVSLLLLLVHCVPVASAAPLSPPPAVIRIGAVLPLTGPLRGTGYRAWLLLNQSLADLRVQRPELLPNTTLELVVENSHSTLRGVSAGVFALARKGATAVLGGAQGLNRISNVAGTESDAMTNSNNDEEVANDNHIGVGSGSAEVTILTWTAASLPVPMHVMTLSATSCARREFSDLTRYPHFSRLCSTADAKSTAMLAAFKQFGWKKMAFFASDDADGWGRSRYSDNDTTGNFQSNGQGEVDYIIQDLMQQMDAETQRTHILRMRMPMQPTLALAAIPDLLKQLQESGIRIVVVYVQGALLYALLRQAFALGMLQYPYVWVGSGNYAGEEATSGMGSGTVSSGGLGPGLCSSTTIKELGDLTPSIASISSADGRLITSYQSSTIGAQSTGAAYVYQADLDFTSSPLLGSICFVPAVPNTPSMANIKYVLENAQGLPFESALTVSDASTYDSLAIYATALQSLIDQGVAPSRTQSDSGEPVAAWEAEVLFGAVRAVQTEGLSGDISFDANGDRWGKIDLLNYDPLGGASGAFVRRGTWSQMGALGVGGFNLTDQLIWPDGSTDLPPDHVNKFEIGQSISPSYNGAIVALSFLYVLLPSALLVFNARRLARSFIESVGSSVGAVDKSAWLGDTARTFGFLGVPGLFAVHHMNVLAMDFGEVGALELSRDTFAGALILSFVVVLILVGAPILIEAWWTARKGAAEQIAVAESFELHLENGEEVQHGDSFGAEAGAKAGANKDKEKEDKKLKPSSKEKMRAARAKARRGGITTNEEVGFLTREWRFLEEKVTPGLLLSAGLLSAAFLAQFYISIKGILLPIEPTIDAGKAFGVWLLGSALFTIMLARVFKDSFNSRRARIVLVFAAVLLTMERAALSTVSWRYSVAPAASAMVGALDSSAIAIAHAILFAIPFFTGLLQLIKALKLSRHSLDSILSSMKGKLASLESALENAKNERKAQAADTDHLKRLLELSNLCRPLHRNHALAFTMADFTTGGPDAAADKKPFVPASFTQDTPVARTTGAPAVRQSIAPGTPNKSGGFAAGSSPATPKQSVGMGGASAFRSPASPTGGGYDRSAVGVSNVRLLGDSTPGTPMAAAAGRKPVSQGISAAAERANLSQGILAANLSGMDFGFLSRPKAEMNGYKLLNELTLELFLASGPVHHRAVADITLAHVLSHPITLELFKDSLTRPGHQEVLAFWLDIQRYKQVDSEELRRALAEQIATAFLYSDAVHGLVGKFLTEKARTGVVDAILSRKSPKRALFLPVEQDILKLLEKEHTNFATTTSFKIVAFLLGHSSYRPSTRIKTLNVGGAAVGAGGALVPITQLAGGGGGAGEASGSGATAALGAAGGAGGAAGGHTHNNRDPESSMGTFGGGFGGGGAGGGGRSNLQVDTKVAKHHGNMDRSPGGSAGTGGASGGTGGGGGRSLLKTTLTKNGGVGAAAAAGGATLKVDAGGSAPGSAGVGVAAPPSPQRASSVVGGGGASGAAAAVASDAEDDAARSPFVLLSGPASDDSPPSPKAGVTVAVAAGSGGTGAEEPASAAAPIPSPSNAAAAAAEAADSDDDADESKPLSPSANQS
jgi:hypothetical protein